MRRLIKIDLSFYFALLLALLSQNMPIYLTYLIAILIHECGHLLIANGFKWELEEVKLTALGGFLTFKDDLTRPPLQSILVALGGIFSNLLFMALLKLLQGPEQLIYTQLAIITFNLLPVVPLDGSRVVQSLLRLRMNYKCTLNVLKVINVLFLAVFFGAVVWFYLESYFIVVAILAIHVFRYNTTTPYLYERYKIRREGW